MSQRSRIWRVALLAFCAFAFLLLCECTWTLTHLQSRPGISVVPGRTAFDVPVKVKAQSPAERDGLRTGDVVEAGALSPADRTRLFMFFWNRGERITLPIVRGDRRLSITVSADRGVNVPWTSWLGYAGAFWSLIFVSVLCIRRPDSFEARLLAVLLILVNIGIALQFNWISPWPGLDASLIAFGQLPTSIGFALLATYSTRFGRPISNARRAVVRLTYALSVAGIAFAWTCSLGRWFGFFDSNRPVYFYVTYALLFVAPAVLPLIASALAIAQSRGTERTRISWAAGSLAFLYLAEFAGDGIIAFSLPVDPVITNLIFNAGFFIVPAGLTYSVLSRRILDVGFALNRAAVFAATTLLLAGLFAGLQWAANAVLTNLSHAHDIALQITIAVVVYYVVRLTRAQTDSAISRVFFAGRDRRIRAVRNLAFSLESVEDAAGIAPFAIDGLRVEAAIDATVLLGDESGTYVAASGSTVECRLTRNSATVVALLSTREPVGVTEPEFPRTVAFPMLVRGRLRGILLCHAQNDDDDFAPDEMLALSTLATQMATARDDLLAESALADLAQLRARNRELEALVFQDRRDTRRLSSDDASRSSYSENA